MTREEAKRRMEICRDFLANNYSDMGEPNFKAFNMAIKALSQEQCNDAEQIDYHDDFATALKKINDYEQKSIEDMPCVTPEEMQKYKEIVKKYTPKQEPCDDAISRDAVIKILEKYNLEMSKIAEDVSELPSVTQKSGKWIELPKALNLNENPCKCSECGHILSFMNYYPKSNYCPNCGCRMVEPQEREDKE